MAKPFVITQPTGTVTVQSTVITDSTATGGAVFNAPIASLNIDGGGNTGWVFGGDDAGFLESFTMESAVESNIDSTSEQLSLDTLISSSMEGINNYVFIRATPDG
jgi:hypothetical protein